MAETSTTTKNQIGKRRPFDSKSYLAYDYQNLLVILAQLIAWASIISLLHQPLGWWVKIPLLVLFCIVMQGVFSFMHECFHDHGNRNHRVNRFLGWIATTIFGSSYTFIRVNHQGHHVRNRTRAELIDYILPGESAALKIVFYYFGIFGGIWLGVLIGALILPFLPYASTTGLRQQKEFNTYSAAFSSFTAADWNMIRVESVLAIFFWICAINLFQWDWKVLLVIYATFGFSWSFLQWVYHVRTPIDVVEGAYNLRLPKFSRLLFLNFNYNLTHHRHPEYRWQELHSATDLQETQPLWYRLLGLLLPPRPMPDDPASIRKTYF